MLELYGIPETFQPFNSNQYIQYIGGKTRLPTAWTQGKTFCFPLCNWVDPIVEYYDPMAGAKSEACCKVPRTA